MPPPPNPGYGPHLFSPTFEKFGILQLYIPDESFFTSNNTQRCESPMGGNTAIETTQLTRLSSKGLMN